jgi:WD40 repeat protein
MTATSRDVKSIFGSALQIQSPADRAVYLDEACGTDAGLRAEVEELLASFDRAGAFMNRPAAAVAAGVTENYEPVTEGPGTDIGRYRLMEQLGEGGMGLVFVAEQREPVRRKVALKIIKPGMDTREVIARFEAERQALALMDHPNIAKVLDAGATESGRPFFVMELAKGVPITEFCDQQQLTPRARLELFGSVCQAAQQAHSKGVIHRDIKPSNVLVTLQEGIPTVKVIDFGVAKAVGQALSDKTVYTRFAQMVGTPLYMSPEQAAGGPDVDTRSDVYALGVLLYELLTGTTPFDSKRMQKAAFDEIRRILKEEDPPRPSTRLSTLGDALSEVSARRKTEPRKLSALVKGDLDWIVMTALEKDRNRRYESAGAFAADVRRYLEEVPIEARPPSALYRFGKMARRNRVALTTAALVAAALIAGTVVSACLAVMAWRAQGEAQDAEANALTAKGESDENARLANQRKDELTTANQGLRKALYKNDMTLLWGAWLGDDLNRFDELMRWRPGPDETDVRGFEWYYWYHVRHGERRTIPLAGGFRDCQAAALSPDGKRLAAVTLANDGTWELRLWDAATGKLLRTFLKMPVGQMWTNDPVPMVYRQHVRIAFSADGRRVALSKGWFWKDVDPTRKPDPLQRSSDKQDREIYVWDVETGDELCHLKVVEGGCRFDALAFGPGGKLLAFAVPWPTSRDRVGDMQRGGVSSFPEQPVTANVYVWDMDGHKAAWTLSAPGTPRELAFSTDGGRLAVSVSREDEKTPDDANQVQVWDTVTRKTPLVVLHKPEGRQLLGTDKPGPLPNGLAFSPDGKRLAVQWGQKPEDRLALYDIGTGKGALLDMPAYSEQGSRPQPVFSADGRRLTYPDPSRSAVDVYDGVTGVRQYIVRGHPGTPAVAFDTDGSLVTAGRDGLIKQWAEPTPRPAAAGLEASDALADRLKGFDGERHGAAHQPDWRQLSRDFSPLASACTPNGLRLARATLAGEGDKVHLEIRIWDEKGGPRRVPIQADVRPNKVKGLLFSKDGTRLVALSMVQFADLRKDHSDLRIWDVESGKEVFKAENAPLFASLQAVSPDGTRIAWSRPGDMQTLTQVLDVNTGRVLLARSTNREVVNVTTFSWDGSRIAWGTLDSVVVWDVNAARETLTIRNPGDPVQLLAFSPDGSRLAGAVGPIYAPAHVKVWDTADGREVVSLRGILGTVHDLAFSPDGSRLATYGFLSWDARGVGVTLWDPAAGLSLLQIDITVVPVGQLRFQPDGRRLFLVYPQVGNPNAIYEVWDATPTEAGPGP